ncbi:MAG: DUF2723 domain-containing protein [Candidatus Promineofilum sp.]|nr:DUF2723 domain-containing protein [Promineifilum sp.]MBP9658041.1 DUF2723 domain-containing protein [Promineifilum sp.]
MLNRISLARIGLLALLLVIPVAYVLTLAQTIVYGDPTEYTFVANILGIAHPPGYAFYTLVGKLFQTLIPIGDVPWRMHLLSAAAATTATLFVFGTVRDVARVLFARRTGEHTALLVDEQKSKEGNGLLAKNLSGADWGVVSGVFAALTVGLGVNFWQHAIHANPHIVTATFLSANLFFLTRWATREAADNRWLYAFSLSAGLGVTHHPLTAISFPAYALFILVVRPRIWREWRVVAGMLSFALVGLAVWLYFPLRSPMEPAFGPSTMNTLNGFLDHVLARGLSESLPFFGAADIPNRAVVFWTILRLQYSPAVIFLAVLGIAWPLAERRSTRAATTTALPAWKPILLYVSAFLCNYAFVMSLRAQDIMAYILGPVLIIGLLAGIGLYGLLMMSSARLRAKTSAMALLAAAIFLMGPGLQLARNAPRVSLRHYTEAADYVTAVFDRFEGSGEGVTLLNDWEHMTPLWYARFVEERWPDEDDVRPVLVSTAQPWLESVFATLPGGPVYLSNYRREVVDAGFRLRPDGSLYQVVEPGDTSIPAGLTPLPAAGDEAVEIVAYDLPRSAVAAGDYVPLTLAMRAPAGTADYYVPVVHVGDLEFAFTTDSHVVTPDWLPGEVIVERFDFALPHDLPDGTYPVTVGLKNLSTDTESAPLHSLGELTVTGRDTPPRLDYLLANFRQRVGLVSATARLGGERRVAVWSEPLAAKPGDTIQLLLQWQSIAKAEEGYTVFVHLIDGDNRPILTLDYTPLGGSAPTHLWIPKWLPGQRLLDPYRLVLPDDLPPGRYYIEVGLYEMVSKRRLHMSDVAGNLIGDRLILGPVDTIEK